MLPWFLIPADCPFDRSSVDLFRVIDYRGFFFVIVFQGRFAFIGRTGILGVIILL